MFFANGNLYRLFVILTYFGKDISVFENVKVFVIDYRKRASFI